MGLEIISIKSSFPKKKETLKDLAKLKDKINLKKIFSSTGINRRFISSKEEDVISLSIKSSKN